MAVYAGMIDMLDKDVGRLIEHLKKTGSYDNTVFFIYADNGAEHTGAGLVYPPYRQYALDNFNTMDEADGFNPENYENMGDHTWYLGPRHEWAMLSNTPFNQYKFTTFEGGIHVAGFLHYPQAKASGIKYDCLHSVIDIAPTILEMADIEYPDTFKGESTSPMQGVSMAGLFQGYMYCNPERWIGWEMNGSSAVRQGNWALSQKLRDDNWYLFNLHDDPFERHDLSKSHPEKLKHMLDLYEQYKEENGVIDVSSIRKK